MKHVVYIHILTLYRQSYNVSILLRRQHSITYKIWRSSSSSSLCRWWSEFHLYESLFANPLWFKQMKNWKNMEALTSSRLRKKELSTISFYQPKSAKFSDIISWSGLFWMNSCQNVQLVWDRAWGSIETRRCFQRSYVHLFAPWILIYAADHPY